PSAAKSSQADSGGASGTAGSTENTGRGGSIGVGGSETSCRTATGFDAVPFGGSSTFARSPYSAAKWEGIQSRDCRYRQTAARALRSSKFVGVERRASRRKL